MRRTRRTLGILACLLTLGCLLALPTAWAEQGVSANEVTVGMSTALSGPAQALGKGVKAGVEAHFAEVNAAGGIHGRKLRLVAADDGYEPDRCAPNMRKLIDEDKVFAVIGNVGTPTAIVSVPIANEKKTLLFGAFTGAGVLRKSPPDRYIINYRASYAEETAAMINGILDDMGVEPQEIAFFTQNDGYGDAGYKGAIKALEAKGYANAKELAHGRYTRNTTNVEDGLIEILEAPVPPKVVIMVGAYKPCAEFIKLAREEGLDAVFMNVSFVGSSALAKELGSDVGGVVVTQVVPHPDSDVPAVVEFRNAMKKHGNGAEPGFVSLEGYLAAKIFAQGLQKAGKDVTREGHVDALESLGSFDVGMGENVSLSAMNHQASHKVWPTILQSGKFIPLEWSGLAGFHASKD